MVGSLGEALAAHHYGIKLSPASSQCHDGVCESRQVQVKATQGNRIALSGEPEHLLVLRLNRDGSFVEEYNGPGALPWKLVADITYFVNLGRNAPYTYDLNQVDPRIGYAVQTAVNQSVANPFYQVLPADKFPGQLRTQRQVPVSELLEPTRRKFW